MVRKQKYNALLFSASRQSEWSPKRVKNGSLAAIDLSSNGGQVSTPVVVLDKQNAQELHDQTTNIEGQRPSHQPRTLATSSSWWNKNSLPYITTKSFMVGPGVDLAMPPWAPAAHPDEEDPTWLVHTITAEVQSADHRMDVSSGEEGAQPEPNKLVATPLKIICNMLINLTCFFNHD